MDLMTTPVLELKIRYGRGEEELIDDVVGFLREKFVKLGVTECVALNTSADEADGEYELAIYVSVPRGKTALDQSIVATTIQSTLHAAFLEAQRFVKNPGPLH